MNRHCIYCTVLVLGAFYINTLVLIVELIICSTRKRGVPTLGEFISTTTTTTKASVKRVGFVLEHLVSMEKH